MNKETKPETRRGTTSVPAVIYSREYFLTACEGYEKFMSGEVSARLQAAIQIAGRIEGKRVLDIGCGRGEVTLCCAQAGADAYGMDYAPEALELAHTTWAVSSGASRGVAHFQLADAQKLPFKQGTFDLVFMLDIVEHLYPEQLQCALHEVHRTLKEDGQLVIHTMPNLWYYRLGYPLYRWVQRMRGQKLPRDPRQRWPFVPQVHVNEQDIWRLRRSLQGAGFQARVWLQPTQSYHEEKNPLIRLFMRVLSSWYPFRWIFCDDIFAVARKSK